jgi:hypothetical protein
MEGQCGSVLPEQYLGLVQYKYYTTKKLALNTKHPSSHSLLSSSLTPTAQFAYSRFLLLFPRTISIATPPITGPCFSTYRWFAPT